MLQHEWVFSPQTACQIHLSRNKDSEKILFFQITVEAETESSAHKKRSRAGGWLAVVAGVVVTCGSPSVSSAKEL